MGDVIRSWSRRAGHVLGGVAVVAFVLVSCGGPTGSPGVATPAGARPSTSPPSAPPSQTPVPPPGTSVEPVATVKLTGAGPIGVDLADDRAWVVLPDSGDLSEVDLASGREVRSIRVGPGGSHVAVGPDAVYVGRFDTSDGGPSLVVVNRDSGAVSGLELGPLESVSYGEGTVWGLEKSGAIRIVDAATGKVTGSASVHIDADAHAEAVPGAGALWVSGDRTPVHRIDPVSGEVDPDIETGGGIPLSFANGLVWGARPDELWAIDPASSTVARRIPITDVAEILALDVDGNEAWIAARRPGRIGVVVRLDLATGLVVSMAAVSLPAGVALTATHAWVTSYDTAELLGFDRAESP
jgi:hypothetical protein